MIFFHNDNNDCNDINAYNNNIIINTVNSNNYNNNNMNNINNNNMNINNMNYNNYLFQTTAALNLRTSAPKVVFPPTARQMTQQKCCDTGRPVMIDPVTGGTICSCQLKSGIPTYLSRVPTLPETVYGAAAAALGNQYSPNVLLGHDSSSAFYQMVRKI